MRWPWRKRIPEGEGRSPFDRKVIRPGDPGWDIYQKVLETGGPVMGIYDARTGEIVSMTPLGDVPPPEDR